MKKSLIALAALSAFATAAQAQSSVTVYGIVDTGYNSLKNTTSGVETKLTAVAGGQLAANGEAATSRLGFRGTEDLGGGMKAHFVIESSIGSTTATAVGDRSFWAGLEDAKLGQLRAGRQDTFTRSVWLAHDQLAFANVVGNLAHSTGTLGAASSSSHDPRRIAINYLSPNFNGVQVMLGMTEDNSQVGSAAKTKTGTGSQVGLMYAAGKFSAGAAYAEATTTTASSTAYSIGVVNTTPTPDTCDALSAATIATPAAGYCTRATTTAATSIKTKDTNFGTSYDLGVAKVAYVYNKREAVNSVDLTTASNVDRTSHAFSASVPVGAKTVLRAGYGFGEIRTGAASNYNGDIKGMQAAVNYNLSKRTMVYGIYGDQSVETSPTAKIKSKEYSVGVRHSF